MFTSLLLIALCGCHFGHALSLDLTGHDGLAGDRNISPDVRSEKESIAESVLAVDPNVGIIRGHLCTEVTCCPYDMACCHANTGCCKLNKVIPASARFC
ncbi:unnamed protein product [Nezara viridula]|uniref:Neuropeptide n=1 Tax=Nezara viridula TaxID=85310 RepID=A0A9P0GWI6_NEZVI|nr:unnamed protein product [Nezara viridula]